MSFKVLLEEIQSNIEKIISELNLESVSFVVEPSKPTFGDVTCNAPFLLSKQLKKKPSEIAKLISDRYHNYLGKLVDRVDPHPSGYLNFFANWSQLNSLILKTSLKDDFGFVNLGRKTKIVVEHTSVNPNKALHVGHVRNVVIGDILARILRQVNYDVRVLNYVDDSGLQVADLVVGFKFLGFQEEPPSGQKFDQYCGDVVYVKTTEKYASDPNLEAKRKEVLQELEEEKSEIARFANAITKKVLAEQLKTCWRLGATYDCLNYESQIIRSGLWQKIFENMKELNLIELEKKGKNANCWMIKSEDNDEDKVLVRSNGTATYIAKDIPYAAWKLGLVSDPFSYTKYEKQFDGKILWQTILEKSKDKKLDFSGDIVITVIDSRQSRLQKIIKNLMSKFKSDENAYLHLSYESVTLSPNTAKKLGVDTKGKRTQMSGRKGWYINADQILDFLEQRAFEETKKRNSDLDDNLLTEISRQIAVGTIRYEMIKQDLDKIITFDYEKSLSLEGDTAPYIQYSHARAARILEKAEIRPNFDSGLDLLESEYEKELLKLIGQFDLQIQDAAKNYSPKVVSRYCYNLAVTFNAFYEHLRVLDLENEPLTNARLCLVTSFKTILKKALNILGISAPLRM